jgi:hypothetical protein
VSANLADALVAAQADMPAVEPDAVNPHFKTKFVSLDHLIAKTRPVLNRHHLALVQLPATSEAGLPVLRTILIHGPSGEQVSADAPLMLGKNDMQGLGAAITYARRYAWAAALGIATEEDDDDESAAKTAEPKAAAATTAGFKPPAAARGGGNGGTKKVSKEQHAAIGALIRTLKESGSPVPADYGDQPDWVEYTRAYARDKFGADSRADLTTAQASQLIDHLTKMEVPF